MKKDSNNRQILKTLKMRRMKNKSLLMTVSILIIAMSSVAQETGTFIDSRDGKTYKTVKIGEQTWMAENLKTTKYKNGDTILNITGGNTLDNFMTGGYHAYENDNNNIKTYGLLYNWHAVNDSRGLCPQGWHVPNDDEWKILILNLRGVRFAGSKMKEAGTLIGKAQMRMQQMIVGFRLYQVAVILMVVV